MNPILEYTKKNLFKQRAYPVYLLSTTALSFVYLALQNYTQISPALMIVYFLVLTLIFGFGSIFINKVRNILNLLSLTLVYICYLLINFVSSATWAGFIVIALMYVQLITNFALMHYERKNLKMDPDSDEFKQMVKAQMNLDEQHNNQDPS